MNRNLHAASPMTQRLLASPSEKDYPLEVIRTLRSWEGRLNSAQEPRTTTVDVGVPCMLRRASCRLGRPTELLKSELKRKLRRKSDVRAPSTELLVNVAFQAKGCPSLIASWKGGFLSKINRSARTSYATNGTSSNTQVIDSTWRVNICRLLLIGFSNILRVV